jgi:pyruvate formate-lyase activating enzyme-like uncharacterized protein
MEKQAGWARRQEFIGANHEEYRDMADRLTWIGEEKAAAGEKERTELIKGAGGHLKWSFSGTKPHTGELSPGCDLCGNGSWSCLFINGKCNCRCFYCPTAQDDIGLPTTNRLTFDKPQDYSDYVREFGFNGVSMSGGEPLLTFEKTLEFIRTVRKKNGEGIHLWMYTNGTLLEKDHVLKLKDAGLSEIRFDLSAWDYRLDNLRLAVGHIPVVTVEIPAVPEDRHLLEKLIPKMHEEGVNHLNLHQLRLTPHNSRLLTKRNYTYLHGEKVTVLESELTALYLLSRAAAGDWKLPINYCAFAYKNQHQRAANRRRNAPFVMKPYESITGNGYIRSLSMTGEAALLEENARRLTAEDPKRASWNQQGKGKILFHERFLGLLDLSSAQVAASYSEAVTAPGLSYYNPFKEIRLNSGKKIYVEKQARAKDLPLTKEGGFPPDCQDYEGIRPGLTDYF